MCSSNSCNIYIAFVVIIFKLQLDGSTMHSTHKISCDAYYQVEGRIHIFDMNLNLNFNCRIFCTVNI